MATTFLVSSLRTELTEHMISVRVKNTIGAARTASGHGPLIPARKELGYDFVTTEMGKIGAPSLPFCVLKGALESVDAKFQQAIDNVEQR